MRLLSLFLPLLLLVSYSLAGPRRTTIEIQKQTVTWTVVHNVTGRPRRCNCQPVTTTTPEPVTECFCEEEETTTPVPARDCPCAFAPTTTAAPECLCEPEVTTTPVPARDCPCALAPTTTAAPTQCLCEPEVTTTPVPARDCPCALAPTTTAAPTQCLCEPEVTTTPEPVRDCPCACTCEPEITTTPKPACACAPAATTTPKPTQAACPCAAKRAIVAADATIGDNVRMCTCDETNACREESSKSVDSCMEECEEQIQDFSGKSKEYLSCFKKNNESILEAETCLFKDMTCNKGKEVKYVVPADWEELAEIKYTSEAEDTIKDNFIWKRDEAKYNKFQSFFHCTKHCMHNKFQQCTAEKACGVEMPAKDDFAAKMNKCIKDNSKIATAINAACRCLAWEKGIKDLQGSCAIIGNKYYIDKA